MGAIFQHLYCTLTIVHNSKILTELRLDTTHCTDYNDTTHCTDYNIQKKYLEILSRNTYGLFYQEHLHRHGFQGPHVFPIHVHTWSHGRSRFLLFLFPLPTFLFFMAITMCIITNNLQGSKLLLFEHHYGDFIFH